MCVPRMLRSGPRLRRAALLIRGPSPREYACFVVQDRRHRIDQARRGGVHGKPRGIDHGGSPGVVRSFLAHMFSRLGTLSAVLSNIEQLVEVPELVVLGKDDL